MINGRVYDYQSVKITTLAGIMLMAESISYKDKTDDEVITNALGMPVGVGRGEYSGTCDLELALSDYNLLVKEAAAVGGFYRLPPTPVIVSYGSPGQIPKVDTLMVKWTERDLGAKKGDKNLMISIKGLLTAPILEDGSPAYIPS